MKYDPIIHHRRSIRLAGYDYTRAGAYYITIVTWQREEIFGEGVNGEMQLSSMGRIAEEYWRLIPKHFSHAELEAFVVMPNHIHGIIILDDDTPRTGTTPAPTRTGTIYRAPTPTEQFQKPVVGSIPTIVRTYKASVSRRIQKEHHEANIWQRNYYEHIIRDQADYERIAGYILSNPVNWDNNEEYFP